MPLALLKLLTGVVIVVVPELFRHDLFSFAAKLTDVLNDVVGPAATDIDVCVSPLPRTSCSCFMFCKFKGFGHVDCAMLLPMTPPSWLETTTSDSAMAATSAELVESLVLSLLTVGMLLTRVMGGMLPDAATLRWAMMLALFLMRVFV